VPSHARHNHLFFEALAGFGGPARPPAVTCTLGRSYNGRTTGGLVDSIERRQERGCGFRRREHWAGDRGHKHTATFVERGGAEASTTRCKCGARSGTPKVPINYDVPTGHDDAARCLGMGGLGFSRRADRVVAVGCRVSVVLCVQHAPVRRCQKRCQVLAGKAGAEVLLGEK
jgi:hypothetical protein